MNIEFKKKDATLTALVEGRIDTTTAPDFLSLLQDNLEGVSKVIVDLANVDFVSSAFIRALLSIRQQLQASEGDIVIRNVRDDIRTIFDVTRVDELITIE